MFVWDTNSNYGVWSDRYRRTDVLLRAVLSSEQYSQLIRNGYLAIKSPRDPERIYRVPRERGLVRMIEQGRSTARLCLQPLERIPDADHVVIHKLMIEAEDETYLQHI